MPPRSRKPKRPVSLSKAVKVAKRINSSSNLMSFSSQLEVEYRGGHLTKAVMASLNAEIASSNIPPVSKKARLMRVKYYYSIVRI